MTDNKLCPYFKSECLKKGCMSYGREIKYVNGMSWFCSALKKTYWDDDKVE